MSKSGRLGHPNTSLGRSGAQWETEVDFISIFIYFVAEANFFGSFVLQTRFRSALWHLRRVAGGLFRVLPARCEGYAN